MRLQRNILAVDDDLNMLRLLETVLAGQGYAVRTAETGSDGAAKGLAPDLDLMVLDLDLPDMNGLEVTRTVRSRSTVPILMLTAHGDVASRVIGLDAGADDYLPKPFNPEELCARVRSLLRRAAMTAPAGLDERDNDTASLTGAGWRLDPTAWKLHRNDGPDVVLTEREAMILAALMQRRGHVVSRDELHRQVTGRPWQVNDRSLDVHISHLRKKIVALGDSSSTIKAVRGRGFIFRSSA